MPIVPALHFFKRTKTAVKQDFEIWRFLEPCTALRTVQIVGRYDVGAVGTEADFHGFSLGQLHGDSNPLFYILVVTTFLKGGNPVQSCLANRGYMTS